MEPRRIRRCIIGLALVAAALFVTASILSFDPAEGPLSSYPSNEALVRPVSNICGTLGAYVSSYSLALLGWVSLPLAVLLGAGGVLLVVRSRLPGHTGAFIAGLAAGHLAALVFLGLQSNQQIGGLNGGAAGLTLAEWLSSRVGWVGTLTVLVLLALVSVLLLAGGSFLSLLCALGSGVRSMFAGLAARLRRRRAEGARTRKASKAARAKAGKAAPAEDWDEEEAFDEALEPGPAAPEPLLEGSEARGQQVVESAGKKSARAPAAAPTPTKAKPPREPKIIKRVQPPTERLDGGVQAYLRGDGNSEETYELPPLDLLDTFENSEMSEDAEDVRQKSRVLERTLQEFKIDAQVVAIQRGPVITMYELALAAGTKVSRVEALANDLAIALKAPNVRLVAPLPGKNTVGIELPNSQRELVGLRELLGGADKKVGRMAIPLMMGKDTAGSPLIIDLAAAPHLLLAGATGSGKSVAINSIICSILMTRTPNEVQMLLVDPKSVEFSDYAGLPHLICPILTDMKRAAAVLQWACKKMDERYALLSRTGVRDLAAYNKLGKEGILRCLNPEEDAAVDDVPFFMPHIVIVIDELGELMLVAAKEVENSVIRLSQKARAVGIHLLCATQRPSVDVITGLIKANLPGRVAFAVSSKVDSRTILDRNGAELLLGRGDMLMLPPGSSRLVRAQGTYMTGEEVLKIVKFWCAQSGPQYRQELRELQAAAANNEAAEDDLYDEAVRIVLESQRGSVSLLQRRLSIGYSRAARLVDMMAEAGIVGSYKGSQAREVTMSLEEWETARQGK